MAVLPFGMWDVGDSFYEAVDLEDEEEDQYEEEDIDNKTQIKIECDDPDRLVGDLLVIAIGTAASVFVEMFVDLPAQNIGEVICSSKDEQPKPKKLEKPRCLLYKVDKCIICQCKSYVKPEDTHHWVKQILSYIKPKQVAVLSSQTKSSFQGDMDVKNSDSDIMRHIKTTSFNKSISSSLLEHGNIISDLPAAVLSYCQVFNVPAVLYVNFTESHFVDVFSLKAYEEVLKDDVLKGLPQVSKAVVSQKLKRFDGVGVADNTLYI